MRNREEIDKNTKDFSYDHQVMTRHILEVLLDIRELLTNKSVAKKDG